MLPWAAGRYPGSASSPCPPRKAGFAGSPWDLVCSGGMNPPSAEVLACGQNARTALTRRPALRGPRGQEKMLLPLYSSSLSTAINASVGSWTVPRVRIFSLPSPQSRLCGVPLGFSMLGWNESTLRRGFGLRPKRSHGAYAPPRAAGPQRARKDAPAPLLVQLEHRHRSVKQTGRWPVCSVGRSGYAARREPSWMLTRPA